MSSPTGPGDDNEGRLGLILSTLRHFLKEGDGDGEVAARMTELAPGIRWDMVIANWMRSCIDETLSPADLVALIALDFIAGEVEDL